MRLGLDETWPFVSCPTQHPCWTVVTPEDSWQPICLLGPCPRAARDSSRADVSCLVSGAVMVLWQAVWLLSLCAPDSFSSPEHSFGFLPICVSQIAVP